MKRLFAILLTLALVLSLAACGGQPAATTAATEATTTAPAETEPVWETGKAALQGKKVIFIGNSYTFCGYNVLTKQNDVLTQAERSNDQGYFYQLCKANFIKVHTKDCFIGK